MSSVALTRDQVRRVDVAAVEEFGISSLVLMENAGRGCAEHISTILRPSTGSPAPSTGSPAPHTSSPTPSRGGRNTSETEPVRVVILCGKGNNAGDGYVIARHLELLGHPVTLVALVSLAALSGDALANASIAKLAGLEICVTPPAEELERLLDSAGVIVDCMLGTGAQGAPREPYVTAIQLANQSTAIRIAIDLPTGLDCDLGTVPGVAFRADHTLTMVAEKVGFAHASATAVLGTVAVIPIGIPRRMLARLGLA